jgi:alginate O-acetyltransferase complex protein AlgI
MLFSSMIFIFVFLPVLCVAYYSVPSRSYRNILLCAASLLFYAWGEPRYILLMMASIAVNYLFGIQIEKNTSHSGRKLFLILAVICNLGALGFFKYAGFFVRNINYFCHTSVYDPGFPLPIGISFYTFQALSYIIDVYWKKTEAQKNFLNLTLYITLFPQLIAGPIVRYIEIENEINNRHESFNNFINGLKQFIIGLAAKVIIANNMAVIADTIFKDYKNSSCMILWIAAIAYTFQIYFDFAGYSRMAIGLGRMFGFHFPQNFNYPYISGSITDFWRRWHITLSSWFRDYVYIPLEGSRCSRTKFIRNIIITWMLTGFWHGAEWNFILWGLYYALLLLIEKLLTGKIIAKLPRLLTIVISMFFVVIGWVLFRITGIADLGNILYRMFTSSDISTRQYIAEHASVMSKSFFFIPAVIASTPVLKTVYGKIHVYTAGFAVELFCIICLFVVSVCMLVASTYNPFIYFRF